MEEGSIEVGTLIEDRYQVQRELGSGSFGSVYACRDTHLGNRPIAIKLFPLAVSQDIASRTRISEELQSAFRIDHDNVVRFYEPVMHEGRAGYTMEFVNGLTLRDFSAQARELPVRELVEILLQIAVGVRAIHEAGIVHGDLKPENILRTQDGIVKISDFGLARRLRLPPPPEAGAAGESRMAAEGLPVYGTLDYASPEYFSSGYIDERADIYAVGVIGYELFTRQKIFDEPNPLNLVHRKITANPRIPKACLPKSPALSAVIENALKRSPEERIQSAEDLVALLRKLFHHVERADALLDAPRRDLTPPSRLRHLLWLALLALVFACVFLFRDRLALVVEEFRYLFE